MVSFTVTRSPFCRFPKVLGQISVLSCHSSCGEAYPVTSRLGDIFTDLLGRETKRTDLGSESRGCTDLTASGAEVAIVFQTRQFSGPQAEGVVSRTGVRFTYMTLISLGSTLGAEQQMLAYTSRGSVAQVECVAELECTGKEGRVCEGERRVAWKRATYAL